MLNKQKARMRIKQAGIMDMLGGIGDYAPEGLGALVGAGSAAGLGGMAGLGDKGNMIAAAIGATIGAMAANKMKEHEQAQMAGIDSNSMLGIQNALMNLDQEAALSGMYGGMDPAMMGGGMGMDPAMMGMDPGMMGGGMPMDPGMMGGGMPMDPGMMGGGPVSGFPDAQQAMQQGKQAQAKQASVKQASVELVKQASALVDEYFA